MGYSMGGAIIRGVLTLAALRHDDQVRTAIDSVVLIHAVTEGQSVLARDTACHAQVPGLGSTITSFYADTIADLSRPAYSGLAPRSPYNSWLADNAASVPHLSTFTLYGDIDFLGAELRTRRLPVRYDRTHPPRRRRRPPGNTRSAGPPRSRWRPVPTRRARASVRGMGRTHHRAVETPDRPAVDRAPPAP